MEKKKAILSVSFGTSYQSARENAIGGIEKALENAFPAYEVRRCFTSGMVIRHIEKEEKILIDGPEAALQKAVADGIEELLIQPTHLMNGQEYRKFMDVLEKYRGRFAVVKTGKPLLSDPEDYAAVISVSEQIWQEAVSDYEKKETALILVGHGSESEADKVYAELQESLRNAGKEHIYVGTIESHPTAAEILESIKDKNYRRVVLVPLMVVAGDHAANDIAGKEENSWKKMFENAGYEAAAVMKGLGEYPEIQAVYAKHLMQV